MIRIKPDLMVLGKAFEVRLPALSTYTHLKNVKTVSQFNSALIVSPSSNIFPPPAGICLSHVVREIAH